MVGLIRWKLPPQGNTINKGVGGTIHVCSNRSSLSKLSVPPLPERASASYRRLEVDFQLLPVMLAKNRLVPEPVSDDSTSQRSGLSRNYVWAGRKNQRSATLVPRQIQSQCRC